MIAPFHSPLRSLRLDQAWDLHLRFCLTSHFWMVVSQHQIFAGFCWLFWQREKSCL